MSSRNVLFAWALTAAIFVAIFTFGFLHRGDRSVICKEQLVGGRVSANGCIRK